MIFTFGDMKRILRAALKETVRLERIERADLKRRLKAVDAKFKREEKARKSKYAREEKARAAKMKRMFPSYKPIRFDFSGFRKKKRPVAAGRASEKTE